MTTHAPTPAPPTTPEEYMKTLPDRIMEVASNHAVVHLQIDAYYVPLLASDLIRGQVMRMGNLGEDMGKTLMEGARETNSIAMSIPAPAARVLAMDLMAGMKLRARLH